jgi:hypothetical protein
MSWLAFLFAFVQIQRPALEVNPSPRANQRNNMSIRAINWAIHLGEREGVTPTMRHILLVLANFASDEDISYPRQTIISKITGLSRPCVNTNLGHLEDAKLITATGRKHANGGTRSSEYKLHIDDNPVDQTNFYKIGGGVNDGNTGGVIENDTRGVKQDDRGVTKDDSGCNPGEQRGIKDDDTLNHTLEPDSEPKARTTKPRRTKPWPEDYRQRFWKAYPKKPGDSRKAAWLKLEKVERDDEVEFDDIMTGLGYYADRMNADVKADSKNVRFIKAASVWINKACWETEQAPVRRAGNAWEGVNGKRVTAI